MEKQKPTTQKQAQKDLPVRPEIDLDVLDHNRTRFPRQSIVRRVGREAARAWNDVAQAFLPQSRGGRD